MTGRPRPEHPCELMRNFNTPAVAVALTCGLCKAGAGDERLESAAAGQGAKLADRLAAIRWSESIYERQEFGEAGDCGLSS